jgi:hypothetical protein
VDARELLNRTAAHAADFLESLDERPLEPAATVDVLRAELGGTLPDGPTDAAAVLDEAHAEGRPPRARVG